MIVKLRVLSAKIRLPLLPGEDNYLLVSKLRSREAKLLTVIFLMQDELVRHGIDLVSKQVVNNSFAAIFTDIKKHNVYNMLLELDTEIIPAIFRESRLCSARLNKLETKVIRMFPKISQSRRRPLLGPSPD